MLICYCQFQFLTKVTRTISKIVTKIKWAKICNCCHHNCKTKIGKYFYAAILFLIKPDIYWKFNIKQLVLLVVSNFVIDLSLTYWRDRTDAPLLTKKIDASRNRGVLTIACHMKILIIYSDEFYKQLCRMLFFLFDRINFYIRFNVRFNVRFM